MRKKAVHHSNFSQLMAEAPHGSEHTAGHLADSVHHTAGRCLTLRLFPVLHLKAPLESGHAVKCPTETAWHEKGASDAFSDGVTTRSISVITVQYGIHAQYGIHLNAPLKVQLTITVDKFALKLHNATDCRHGNARGWDHLNTSNSLCSVRLNEPATYLHLFHHLWTLCWALKHLTNR